MKSAGRAKPEITLYAKIGQADITLCYVEKDRNPNS